VRFDGNPLVVIRRELRGLARPLPVWPQLLG
jgi:hypothetical protein